MHFRDQSPIGGDCAVESNDAADPELPFFFGQLAVRTDEMIRHSDDVADFCAQVAGQPVVEDNLADAVGLSDLAVAESRWNRRLFEPERPERGTGINGEKL